MARQMLRRNIFRQLHDVVITGRFRQIKRTLCPEFTGFQRHHPTTPDRPFFHQLLGDELKTAEGIAQENKA